MISLGIDSDCMSMTIVVLFICIIIILRETGVSNENEKEINRFINY
jgi:hypothetical protein